MSLSYRSDEASFSCPSGSNSEWYACATDSNFVGCCAGDPCNSVGCALGNTYPASYEPEDYGKYPDASCGRNSQFYTCTFHDNSTFWGCCKTNACQQNGCPEGDLVPAYLDGPTQINGYISGSSATATPEKKAPIGAIVGGSVGGGVALLIIIGFILYYIFRVRRSRGKHQDGVEEHLTTFSPPGTEKLQQGPYHDTPPPPFSPYASPTFDSTSGFAPTTKYMHQAPENTLYELADASALSPNSGIASKHRYSELPSDTPISSPQLGNSTPMDAKRISELPSETPRSELESPLASPMISDAGGWSTNPNHQSGPVQTGSGGQREGEK